jgi:hypothetical protein
VSDSFTATYAPLVEQVRAARDQGDERAERLVLEQLIKAYVRLGNRELGTAEEQRDYIIARHLGYLPEALQELGVHPDKVPMPPGRRSPAPPPAAPTDSGATRIAERFAQLGGHDEPTDRFIVHERPQDGMFCKGRPAPFAVVDTHDGLPVSWHPDRDWAEYTAETASRLRRSG